MTGHKQTIGGTDYTTAYTYKLNGALYEETYPSGRVVKNTYADNGDLSRVYSPIGEYEKTYASNFVYNAARAVTSLQLGNSKYENTVFNSRLQPTQIGLGTTSSNANILQLDYTYGTTANNGNVLSQTITVPGVTYPFVQNYTYDSLNRLESATETYNTSTQTWKQEFSYDRYGNKNYVTGSGHTTTLGSCAAAQCNPTFNTSTNRFASGQGYSYDSSGNITVDAEGREFTYDAENKQTQVTLMLEKGGLTTMGSYFYDGDGKRVKKTSYTSDNIIFIYDAAGKLIEERNSSTGALITSYVYAGGRLLSTETSSATTYITADHLGSPRINTDASGNVVARHDYMPFGEEIFPWLTTQRTSGVGYTSDTVRKQFTGYERDGETGLDFAQARMFVSSLGRFTAVDPYEIILEIQAAQNDPKISEAYRSHLQQPQRWNRYPYAMGNPLKFIDPNGEDAMVVVFKDFKINVSGSGVPLLGHAGIVLIDENGTATYYDYGRYDPENKGIVRDPIDLPKLEFSSDGVATQESVTNLMKALSEKVGQRGSVEGAYFNTSRETTDAMKTYAEGRRRENRTEGRDPYSLINKNCMTFTREVLAGGGVDLKTTENLGQFGTAKAGGAEPSGSSPVPTLDIGYIQRGTYSVPREGRSQSKPGRIPYKPSK